MASYSGHSSSKPTNKLKPVLRKLTQNEKNSLDLNRPAFEQRYGISSDYGNASQSAMDVNFQPTRRGFHTRSTSGTSQFSTNTTGSNRNGSFVHPFQQTPRPYTPPLVASYAGSFRDSEYSRDSPVFPDDDDIYRPSTTYRAPSSLSQNAVSTSGLPRLQTGTKPPSRLGATPSSIPTSFHNLSQELISPPENLHSASTMRSSMDKSYRFRSNSQTDTRPRAESIREARRRFEEKELAKEQKAQLAEVKAIEKQNLREAKQLEKAARKSSVGEGIRPKRSRSDLLAAQEKTPAAEFLGRDYNSAPVLDAPVAVDAIPEAAPRQRTTTGAKKKTHSAWTQFMMWLRTRILRMKGRPREK